MTGKSRAGDIRHCFGDISAARKQLGYKPRVRLKQGIKELAGWLRSQEANDHVEEAMARLNVHGLVA
jgi:dTDP-L-rhamnose 4-epimerase